MSEPALPEKPKEPMELKCAECRNVLKEAVPLGEDFLCIACSMPWGPAACIMCDSDGFVGNVLCTICDGEGYISRKKARKLARRLEHEKGKVQDAEVPCLEAIPADSAPAGEAGTVQIPIF
jgi:ribosomal protein L33